MSQTLYSNLFQQTGSLPLDIIFSKRTSPPLNTIFSKRAVYAPLDTFFSKRATASGSKAWSILTVSSVITWIPRSAPIARAVLMVSLEAFGPTETATISLAFFCSCYTDTQNNRTTAEYFESEGYSIFRKRAITRTVFKEANGMARSTWLR